VSAPDEQQERAARLWRLRAPSGDRLAGTAVSVRLDATETEVRVWVAVGNRHRRLPLSLDEAWAVFKLLGEALEFAGEPPEFVKVPIRPVKK
jgi:hypothetical protein